MSTIMTRSGAKYWWGVDLPKGVLSLTRKHPGGEWVEYTRKQLSAQKTENQNFNIEYKRRSKKVAPCFVWVFLNNSFLFGGWYAYIKTVRREYALNFRNINEKIVERIMELFPCGILASLAFFERWMEEFAEEYHHDGLGGRKKQGLVKCWCVVDEGGELEDVFVRRGEKEYGV